jgi:hypothetical protein
MITGPTKLRVYHDDHTNNFTVQIGWCEPAPNLLISGEFEGHGETLSDALYDLAAEIKAQFEDEDGPLG